MFGPSLGACAGSGWVSRKKPSAPAAAAAREQRRNALAQPRRSRRLRPRPGCCTLWVASKTTGAPARVAQAREVPHVHHQVAVAEEGAALGHRHLAAHRRCRTFSTAPAIPSGGIHWPFLTFTGLPVAPAATSRSVCRQRKAGIWSTSATCGGRGDLRRPRARRSGPAGRWPPHPLERREALLEAGAACRAGRAGWPCRSSP